MPGRPHTQDGCGDAATTSRTASQIEVVRREPPGGHEHALVGTRQLASRHDAADGARRITVLLITYVPWMTRGLLEALGRR